MTCCVEHLPVLTARTPTEYLTVTVMQCRLFAAPLFGLFFADLQPILPSDLTRSTLVYVFRRGTYLYP